MWFLTGFDEPNAVAVFCKNAAAGTATYALFCEETTPHDALWHGERIGCRRAVQDFGADLAFPRKSLLEETQRLYESLVVCPEKTALGMGAPLLCIDGVDNAADACISAWMGSGRGPATKLSAKTIMNSLRMRKSADMQKMLQRSADITAAMFRAAMVRTAPGEGEQSIQAVMDFVAQRNGASGFAYVPVVAGGRNALCLHYISNKASLKDGELLMVDAGADYHYYPTDCTRAWPISGRFSQPQRTLYESLLRVQQALIKRVRVGASIRDMQRLSEEMLREEMCSIGFFAKDMPLDRQRALVGEIYPHGWGHPMGLDIHESFPPGCAQFEAGMMHTVEPGIYVPDDARFPAEYRGIGFRIEDNVLVTAGEPVVTTAGIPKEVDAIEGVMREAAGQWANSALWDIVVP